MRYTILLMFALCCNSIYSKAQTSSQNFKFQTGDLAFQDLDCGDLCDAIEAVTPAVNDKHFSHVGLVYCVGDSIYIIEAIGKDVHLTSLPNFLKRQVDSNGKPKVVIGRLKPAYQKLNARAVGFALQQMGKPYDDIFIYNNDKYYCSELVYDAYKAANGDQPFFNLYPMTFKDPQNGKTYPAWKKHYQKLNANIPEGKLGCNPGSIAISDVVEIVTTFY